MEKTDWERVAEIYKQALEKGIATFNTQCPSYVEWDLAHHSDCRYVYVDADRVVGWIAISPTSVRSAYQGSVEVSIYVDNAYQGKGIGRSLMNTLIETAPEHGYWSLYSAIFSVNTASIALHKKCGFREIGYRERIARDRFGVWQNTTLMEIRL